MPRSLAKVAPSSSASPLVAVVRAFYEAHPYPRYPLLARPRWQEGYLASSRFAARLFADLGSGSSEPLTTPAPHRPATATAENPDKDHRVPPVERPSHLLPTDDTRPSYTVLLGGGGEILPYVVRRWEPAGHRVVTVDLSARSLRRARFRLLSTARRTTFVRGDLDAHLGASTRHAFAHADLYGVVHHMPNPGATLAAVARVLAPNGTIRLMVYNSTARIWIHHLQRLFALLAVDRFDKGDLRFARELLSMLANEAPALKERLQGMGHTTLASQARLADTFLHPREVRLPLTAWLTVAQNAGLTALGLFDRYGELDDLPNPLWRMPTANELEERAADRRFENNLELFLVKAGPRRPQSSPASRDLPEAQAALWPYLVKAPPRAWFSYDETRSVPLRLRRLLWRSHLAWTLRHEIVDLTAVYSALPLAALQRLARLGVILPGQTEDLALRAHLLAPMTASMESPVRPPSRDLCRSQVARLVETRLMITGRFTTRLYAAALKRLEAAQEA